MDDRDKLGRELAIRLWYWRNLNKAHLKDKDWQKTTEALQKARLAGWLPLECEFP